MRNRTLLIAAVISLGFGVTMFAGSEKISGADIHQLQIQCGLSSSSIPEVINYQGILTDGGGNPLKATVSMTFTLYDAYSGGTALWTEIHGSVTVVGGLFSVLLGSVTPIAGTVFDGPDRWLGVAVGGDPEMERERLASVPYAYRCGDGGLEGPEAGTYCRGSSQLENGRAVIRLPEHFALVTENQGITVQVTPTLMCNGLMVTNKSASEIEVWELGNCTSNTTFDYFVNGIRKGYRDHQVVGNRVESD